MSGRFVRPDFEALRHVYTNPVNGQEISSVTRILEAMRLYQDLSFLDKKYRQRGQAVHMGCLMLLQGESMEVTKQSFHPEIWPYLEAFGEHYRRSGCYPVLDHCEQPICDTVMNYAGTPDFVMRRHMGGKTELWDAKSGQQVPLVGLQLAAYDCLLTGLGLKIDHRYEINLRDGKPNVSEYSEPLWKVRWNSTINVYNMGREVRCW